MLDVREGSFEMIFWYNAFNEKSHEVGEQNQLFTRIEKKCFFWIGFLENRINIFGRPTNKIK